jgi:hypothetical protein
MFILASDDAAFNELQYCVSSITESDRIIVYDLGLNATNLEWLKQRGMRIRTCAFPTLRHPQWRKFVKPFVLDDLPAGDYLYTDVDVIFSAQYRFQRNGFTAFKEHAPCRNPTELRVAEAHCDLYNVNSGYIYFTKPIDNWLIEQWCLETLSLSDKGLLDLPHSYDQGVLQYVLEKHKIKVLEGSEVDHNPVRDILNSDLDPVAQIREYQKDNLASHFAGYPKISHLMQLNHPKTLEGLKVCKGEIQPIKMVILADQPETVRISLKQSSAWFNNYYYNGQHRQDTHADILITTDTDIQKHQADIYLAFTVREFRPIQNMIYIHPVLSAEAIVPIVKLHYDIPFRSAFEPLLGNYNTKFVDKLRQYTSNVYMPGKYI